MGSGDIPVYGSGGIMAQVNTCIYDKPTVLIPRKGSIDKLYYTEKPFWNVDTIFYTEIDENFTIAKYIYYCLQKEHLEDYNTAGGVPSLDPVIKAETVFIQECYPEEVKQADSLIGEWLKANGFTKQAEEYELIPFDIHVQTMERTLVDKVFALCDYMLLDDMKKHSRHIYDIYQLLGRVELNDDFRALVHRVREDRKYHSLCISAQDNADVPALLKRVIETGCYKKDYEEHTRTMLYAPCDYEEAITGLEKIIDSGMFGKDEEYERNTVHISVSSAAKIASYKEYRLCKMPENGKYGDYTYKIPNKYVSINRSEKAIVLHLPKDYVVELRNGRTNQTAGLTVTEFAAEVADKDESAYGTKIIRPSQLSSDGNTHKKETGFNSK